MYTISSEIEGIETIAVLRARVSEFLGEIAKKHRGQTVVIVAHSGIARAIYFYFYPVPADGDLRVYKIKNAGVERYSF